MEEFDAIAGQVGRCETVCKTAFMLSVETPIAEYDLVWAIVKVADVKLYLVRMTKSTRNFMNLRSSEVDKVRCGQAQFRALGLGLEVVPLSSEIEPS